MKRTAPRAPNKIVNVFVGHKFNQTFFDSYKHLVKIEVYWMQEKKSGVNEKLVVFLHKKHNNDAIIFKFLGG